MRKLFLAYLTGQSGVSLALFSIGDGIIAGGDVGGILYDGSFEIQNDVLVGLINFTVPPESQLISGQSTANEPVSVALPFTLPLDFETREFVRIEAPGGPINARFVALRELV